MRSSPIAYRRDIDGLRALAILPVLVYHAMPNALPGGFVGVDVFFVISGFLITSIIRVHQDESRFRFRDFYARRIVRIFPALALVLAAVLGIGAWLSTPSEWQDISRQVIAGAGFVSNLFLWRTTDYFTADFTQQPLLHLWSLGIEEQFYILWPLILVLLARREASRWPVVAALALASFAANLLMARHDAQADFYLPATRAWELLAGALLALRRRPEGQLGEAFARATPVHDVLSAAGIAAILFACVRFNDKLTYPGVHALLPVAGAAAIIAAGPFAWANRHVLGSRGAVYIGLISYPLYLWHLPLVYVGRAIDTDSQMVARALRLGLVLLSFVLAASTYRLLERPIHRVERGRAVKWLCGSLLACVALAFGVVALHGVPSRFDAEKLRIVDAMESARASHVAQYREGTCFIAKDAQQDDVDAACVPAQPGGLVVWGDSYAAHLMPGLRALRQPGKPEAGQLTAGACAPLSTDDTPRGDIHCATVNKAFLRRLDIAKPAVVILSASWTAYSDGAAFAADLEATVRRLQASGARVVLVGQAVAFGGPQWLAAARHPLAQRAANPALPTLRRADDAVRRVATATGADFMSPLEALCQGSACAVQVPATGSLQLMSWDTGHLTPAGSTWYAARMAAMPALRDWIRVPG